MRRYIVTILCDTPGCASRIEGRGLPAVLLRARDGGWRVSVDGLDDRCALHNPKTSARDRAATESQE